MLNQIAISVVGFIILILISIPLSKNISKRIQVNREIKELENEIESIENKNGQLNGLIGYLQSDNFIEEQARLNLGLKKEGEDVMVITEPLLDTETEIESVRAENVGNNSKINNRLLRWYSFFFAG